MKNIYIDVSLLLQNSMITGIQRVVRNVTLELLKLDNENIKLISYNPEIKKYVLIDGDKYSKYYSSYKGGNKSQLFTNEVIEIDNFESGSIFFDLDSVWSSQITRSYLYPILKKKGVIVVTYVYDIVPILYPDFCDVITVNQFMGYIGAALMYSDYVITSTKTVIDELEVLANKLGIECPKGDYSWLGSNFNNIEAKISENIQEILSNKKYVLSVGTIEPRKNIGFLLDAFDEKLFDEGLYLVLAGGRGWKTDDLINRINNHPLKDKQLFFLQGLDDSAIQYLYKNSLCVAFPTFDEGFGLPIVEAFERGVPVLASDKAVLKEVGRGLSEHFTIDNTNEFIELVSKYANDDEYRNKKITQIKEGYERVTWSDVAKKILDILSEVTYTSKEITRESLFDRVNDSYLEYANKYRNKYGEYPVISIVLDDAVKVRSPRYIEKNVGVLTMPVCVNGDITDILKVNGIEINKKESLINIDTNNEIEITVSYNTLHKKIKIH